MAMAMSMARRAMGQLWNGAAQARSVYVDARGLNYEQALGRYGRKLRQDKTLNDLLKREYYMKPSEKKRQSKKERDKRMRKRELKLKLKLVAKVRALGL